MDTQGHSWPELGKEVPGECAFFWEGVQCDWNREARAKTERTAWIWGHNGVWQWLASYHGEELLALAWNVSNPADTKWKLLMVRLSCTAGGKGPPPSPGLRRTDSDWLAHLSSKTDRQAHRERQTVSWQPRSPPHSDIIHTEIFYPSYKLTFLCSLKDVINKFWRLFKVPPPSHMFGTGEVAMLASTQWKGKHTSTKRPLSERCETGMLEPSHHHNHHLP